MPNSAVGFANVTFAHDKAPPLFEGLSLELTNNNGAGKVIALMGPSGVGKTTFCDLILGVRRPQRGTVTVRPPQASVSVIPQRAVIFEELSLMENITCLRYSESVGSTFKAEKVEDVICSLGLLPAMASGTAVRNLSGGEAQRVMLARVQTIDCQLLLLDEPCSFLDNRVKDSFLQALRATVVSSGLLALMITHVWDEAQLIADEVLFFHRMSGGPVTVHAKPVEEARWWPPTLDSLYSIHWPNCCVLKAADESLTNEDTCSVPRGAHWIGLFSSPCVPNATTSGSMSARFRASQRLTAKMSSKFARGCQNDEVALVFYDQQGVAL